MSRGYEPTPSILTIAALFITSVCLFSSISHAQDVCVPPPEGLVSWWPGDADASDIVNGNDGVLINGALAGVEGKVGGAFSFDGVNDRTIATASSRPIPRSRSRAAVSLTCRRSPA